MLILNKSHLIIYILLLSIITITGCTQESAENAASSTTDSNTIVIGVEQNNQADTPLEVGLAAPDFTVMGLTKDTIQLEQYKGRPVLLNFWASWCGPCVAEMFEMQRLSQEPKYKDLAILAINYGESAATAKRFVDAFGINFEIGLDQWLKIGRLYKVYALPTSYFIDSDGILRKRQVGQMDRATLEARLSSIVKIH